jgi:RNA polymerase sigma factor (sigma-70 family)
MKTSRGRWRGKARPARRYGETILLVALKWFRLSLHDAEEVLNDTLWAAVQAASDFDPGKGSLRSWLVGIACNRARRKFERSQSAPLLEGSWNTEQGPPEAMMLQEAREAIEDACREMTPLQRDIVEAMLDRGSEGVTDRMLAGRHGTTPQTVKVERWRVRRKLARFLRVNHDA